jgi:hypothetical protein
VLATGIKMVRSLIKIDTTNNKNKKVTRNQSVDDNPSLIDNRINSQDMSNIPENGHCPA